MYWRYALHLMAMITVSVISVGLVTALPIFFIRLNLVLVVLVFLLLFNNMQLLFTWLVGLGFINFVFSHLPFGANMISIWLTIIICYFVLNHFLTNRSLYSLLFLTLIAVVSHEIILFLALSFAGIFTGVHYSLPLDFVWVKGLFWSLVVNGSAIIVLFHIMTLVNPQLKPFILAKRH